MEDRYMLIYWEEVEELVTDTWERPTVYIKHKSKGQVVSFFETKKSLLSHVNYIIRNNKIISDFSVHKIKIEQQFEVKKKPEVGGDELEIEYNKKFFGYELIEKELKNGK